MRVLLNFGAVIFYFQVGCYLHFEPRSHRFFQGKAFEMAQVGRNMGLRHPKMRSLRSKNGYASEIWFLYPLVMTNIAIENGHRNSGFSHEKL